MSMHCDRAWGRGKPQVPIHSADSSSEWCPCLLCNFLWSTYFLPITGMRVRNACRLWQPPRLFLSYCSGLVYATISKRGSLMADLIVFWLLHYFHPLFCGIPWALLTVGVRIHTVHWSLYCVYVSFSVMVSSSEQLALNAHTHNENELSRLYLYICPFIYNIYVTIIKRGHRFEMVRAWEGLRGKGQKQVMCLYFN